MDGTREARRDAAIAQEPPVAAERLTQRNEEV